MPAPALRFGPRFVVYQPKPAMPKARFKSPRTQFFASALETLMERNGINQIQMMAATGIAVSRVNNYLHGKYRTIRPDHLGLLAKAAARTQAERGELARAYVQDLLPEELHGDLRLEVAGDSGKAARPARLEKSLLSSAAVTALVELQALSVRSAKARARMQLFAEILREAHGA
jgi:transcriptional regulator with XRE-family HTH domain